MTLIYITTKNKVEAKKISKHLLNKKLIACANLHPIESLYWWKGKIQEDKEIVIIVKTTEQNFKKVETEIRKLHSYDVPCILKIPTECNKEYQDWVDKVTL
jgi:periplasmic divalent cation tolerance protein